MNFFICFDWLNNDNKDKNKNFEKKIELEFKLVNIKGLHLLRSQSSLGHFGEK